MAVQKVGKVKNKTKTKSAQQQDGHTYTRLQGTGKLRGERVCVCVG